MSFLNQMRARSKSGPGAVEIIFPDGEVVEVPLKYPKAKEQAELKSFMEATKKLAESDEEPDLLEYTDGLSALMVRLCMKLPNDEEMTDDEVFIMIRESGGFQGALVQRCAQLLGLGHAAGNGGEVRSRVVKKPKRTSTKQRS